jgi:acyl-CoA dehydrogenase
MTAIALELPDELRGVLVDLEAFLAEEVVARHGKHAELLEDPRRLYDEDGRHSPAAQELIREVRTASAAAGFFNLSVPHSLGGRGLGYLAYYAAWELINRTCGPLNWLGTFALSHWAFGPSAVLEQVTDEARATFLPGLMSGETSMCFGLSEPGAGSDASALTTRAEPDGDGWRLHGRKIWTTNVTFADWMVAFAVTGEPTAGRPAISAFLVPTDAEGFHLERVIRMHGQIGGVEGETLLDGVRVEPWQLVGPLHGGLRIGLLGVSLGRVYNSARSVGLARWSLEKAIAYAKDRVAFGQPIAEYQGVSFPLAESAMQVHAAHLMGLNVAQLLDRGERAVKELSMTKAYSVEVCLRAVDRAIQTHGARGFVNEEGLTEAYNTLRLINVADGTNEILRRTVFQQLARGDLDL